MFCSLHGCGRSLCVSISDKKQQQLQTTINCRCDGSQSMGMFHYTATLGRTRSWTGVSCTHSGTSKLDSITMYLGSCLKFIRTWLLSGACSF